MPEILQKIPDQELLNFLQSSSKFSNIDSFDSELLAGDGFGRSYYRINCKGSALSTAVLLMTPEGIGPKLSGDTSYTQEQAFVEICKFFNIQDIPAPEFYSYHPAKHWVLVEDVGNLPLFQFVNQQVNDKSRSSYEQVSDQLGSDVVSVLFKKAILLIKKLQNLKFDSKVIAFRRYLAFENYRNEISEFSDYYAQPKGLKTAELLELNKIYDAICETILSFPKALSYFDFNAHNLFVSDQGELRVLDFQDACMVSPARDILSLINDRGMDECLGNKRHSELLRYYIEQINPGPEFPYIYDTTLLHWDLRVSGRFIKLNQKFETDKYNQWIPSTLRRLGRTLKRSEKTIHGLSNLLEIVYRISPEVREGYADCDKF